jgi:uncharacterized protein YcfJ
MSISSTKMVVALAAAGLTVASSGAFAQEDRYDPRYDQGYDNRYENGNDDAYDYAKVVDVQPLTRQVRVTTPQRECWDETRVDPSGGYRNGPLPRTTAGATVLGAVIGGVIGNQIGHGQGRHAATAAGAIIGAGIGHEQAQRRNAQYGVYNPGPAREYTVQRCETRYREDVQERIDGYRVTYMYNGRRQVTEMAHRPGDRIRVRVDVSPAE